MRPVCEVAQYPFDDVRVYAHILEFCASMCGCMMLNAEEKSKNLILTHEEVFSPNEKKQNVACAVKHQPPP